MPDAPHQTDAVFGITRGVPLNYVVREHVDTKLKESLDRSKHVVIHGSSKQGKTCLRKECIPEPDCIVVQCSNKWTLLDLHSSILKQAGYEVTQSTSRSHTGKLKINVKVADAELSRTQANTVRPLELDAEDVNDIIKALAGLDFSKLVVLEDFHYLPIETQKDFSVAMKAFHEKSSFCFVIVGVWLEANRLVVYNGDLTGRLISVDADSWPAPDLRKVVEAGEYLLNIKFDDDFVESLISESSDSVSILQEVCYKACKLAGVQHTQEERMPVGGASIRRNLFKTP